MKGFQKTVTKNLLTAFVLVFGLFTATAAEVLPQMEVAKSGEPRKVMLNIANTDYATQLEVRDAFGTVLMEQSIASGDVYRKVLNLGALPTGKYELTLVTPTRELVQPLLLKDGEVEIDETLRFVRYLPAVNFSQVNRTLDLNYFNVNGARVKLNLSDVDGEVVHQDTLDKVTRIERRYDLSQLRPGNYKLSITTESGTYYHSIAIGY